MPLNPQWFWKWRFCHLSSPWPSCSVLDPAVAGSHSTHQGALGRHWFGPGDSEASLLLIVPFGLAPNRPLASLAEVNLYFLGLMQLSPLLWHREFAPQYRCCVIGLQPCHLCIYFVIQKNIPATTDPLFGEIRRGIGHFLCVNTRSVALADLHSSHCDQFSWL